MRMKRLLGAVGGVLGGGIGDTEDVEVLTGLGDPVTNLLNTGLGFADLPDVDLLKVER